MAAGAAALALPLPIPHRPTRISSHPRSKTLNLFSYRRPLHRVSSSLAQSEQELSFTEPEAALIEALLGVQGRGRSASPRQLKDVEEAVQALEELRGVPEPTNSDLIEGCWQLIFTTRPGTASPIQAAATIDDGKRILFRFDRAAFSFKFLPFKVPYPVPFRLLGDEAKGWLDTTYLSVTGNIRVSRGNKCRERHLCCKRKLSQDRDYYQPYLLELE